MYLNQPDSNMEQQRRLLLAVVALGALLVVWQAFFTPKPPPPPPPVEEGETASQEEDDGADDEETAEEAPETDAPDVDALPPQFIETEHARFALTNVGARLAHVDILFPERFAPRNDMMGVFPQLPECPEDEPECDEQAEDLDDALLPLALRVEGIRELDEDSVYVFDEAESTCAAGSCERLTYRWTSRDGQVEVIRRYYPDEHPFGLVAEVEIVNHAEDDLDIDDLEMVLYGNYSSKGGGMFGVQAAGQVDGFCLVDDKQKKKPGKKLDETRTYRGNVTFTALNERYFMTAIAPRDEDGGAGSAARCHFGQAPESPGDTMFALVSTGPFEVDGGSSEIHRYTVYSGPKPFEYLHDYPHDFEKSVTYGAFSFLALPIRWVLVTFHGLVGNWGVAIILLTIAIKLLLLPITTRSFRSMEKMGAVRPKMEALQKKYENDRQKLAEEQMKLFKDEGVNPLGGCLPMFLQMPVYFALYRTIYGTAELYNAPFALWLQDLSQRDPYFVLPILMSIIMFAQQRLMPRAVDNPQMKMMQWIMPLMFIPIMLFLPSGLVLYIFVNMLLSVAQQLYIKKYVKKEESASGRSRR